MSSLTDYVAGTESSSLTIEFTTLYRSWEEDNILYTLMVVPEAIATFSILTINQQYQQSPCYHFLRPSIVKPDMVRFKEPSIVRLALRVFLHFGLLHGIKHRKLQKQLLVPTWSGFMFLIMLW